MTSAPEQQSPVSRLRVVVADDHPLFLDGIAALVRESPDLDLVGAASSGQELVELVRTTDPDVVVTDLRMPGMNGVSTIRELAADGARRVLVLSMHDEDRLVAAAMRAGARGYALKESPPAVVRNAITAVGQGMLVLGPGVPSAPAPFGPAVDTTDQLFPELTPRERDIVRLVAAGRTNLAVARSLTLSEKTVRNSLSSILVKTHLRDRAALIDRARLDQHTTGPGDRDPDAGVAVRLHNHDGLRRE